MTADELERIAKHALRELGAGDPPVTVTPVAPGNRWRLEVGGSMPLTLTLRGGPGTSAQFIRDQIFDQFSSR